ncbi:MAG: hypothetical protein JWM14_3186 [Chitinophagaceae bacterium]|nr:hypothetical protein [Chitinophagaceae bacterium]
MRKTLYVFILCAIGFTGYSQTSDSLNAIEQQQEELRQQQLRLQAKQDSLQREQDRISAEKVKQQQQVAQPVITTVAEKEQRHNHTVIAFHPLFAVFGQVDFSLEQSISKTSSLYLEFGYHDFNLRENSTVAAFMPGDWIAYTGYRAELQYRYYALPEAGALYKLYIAPHVYYKQDEVSRGEGDHYDNNNGLNRQYEFYNQYQAQAMGAGVSIGYQIQFLRHLTFDSSVGASYTMPLTGKTVSDIAHLPLVNPYKEGMMLRMNLSLGFAF